MENKHRAYIPFVLFLLEVVDIFHDIPVGRAQATGIPYAPHQLGMERFVDGSGEFGGKVVTSVGTDTPASTPLGFQEEIDRIYDRGEKRVREMGTGLCGLYLSLLGEEEDLGRIPRDLDHGFDLSVEVPCMMFLF